MRTNMGQCMETIQALSLRQEELRQVLQNTCRNINLVPIDGLVNQNVQNTIEIHSPIKEMSHHENDSYSKDFRFHINDIEKKFHLMKKRFKAIKGCNSVDLDVDGLCLVPSINIPAKFRVPDFENYMGTTCP